MRSKSADIMNEILNYINEVFFDTREVPTVQDIADKVGIAKSSASRYLSEMESRGMLYRNSAFYGIETTKMKKAMKRISLMPVVGEIACGTPILAEENIESYLSISPDFLGPGEFFVLKAKGDSMINVGIHDGDLVIIRKQSTADEGQIVVALTEEGECTLKKYYLDKRRRKIRLHPENDEMKDMYFDTIQIQGVAVKIIQDIKL
jgi:repressor LexA